jgi:hypothetical protein
MANVKVMIDGEIPDAELQNLLKMAGVPLSGCETLPPPSDTMTHPYHGDLSQAAVARNNMDAINKINHLGTYTESEDSDEEDVEDDKKEVEENADYDYGINPSSRKGFASGFNPYDYEGTADEQLRNVPARMADNPLKGIKSGNPHISENRSLIQYLQEVEDKKAKNLKKKENLKKKKS